MTKTYVVYVCSGCGEQIDAQPEYDEKRGIYVRGHYHDPPEGWSEGEDPWFDAVPIQTAALNHEAAS